MIMFKLKKGLRFFFGFEILFFSLKNYSQRKFEEVRLNQISKMTLTFEIKTIYLLTFIRRLLKKIASRCMLNYFRILYSKVSKYNIDKNSKSL